MKIARTLAVVALSFAVLSCASSDMDKDEMATVAGSISYKEAITLGSDAVAYVQIIDLDLKDKPGFLVASKAIHTPGQLPIEWTLTYWMERVESGHTYALQARIEDGGIVVFKTAEDVKFDAKEPERQELVLVSAR